MNINEVMEICEFLGYKKGIATTSMLDWNMLYKAVDKIECTGVKNRFGQKDIYYMTVNKTGVKWIAKFQSLLFKEEFEAESEKCDTRFEAVFRSVLIFIRTYKENNTHRHA